MAGRLFCEFPLSSEAGDDRDEAGAVSACPGPRWRGMRPDSMTCLLTSRSGGGCGSTWRGCWRAGPEQDADGAGRGRAGYGAQHPAVQRLQFFLSESCWGPEKVNARRLELLLAGPATAPHGGGVLVLDDSGDRKDGSKTAHVGHQWLGWYGKTDNGVVTVTTLCAGERLCYPLDAVP
jgi:DDE superfamily endonuclease